MKQLITIASVAALAIAAPAYAKPGKGHGNSSKHANHSAMGHYGDSAGGCPPGLAKEGNGCMPLGQAKKMFNVGQRYLDPRTRLVQQVVSALLR